MRLGSLCRAHFDDWHAVKEGTRFVLESRWSHNVYIIWHTCKIGCYFSSLVLYTERTATYDSVATRPKREFKSERANALSILEAILGNQG
jgi:hypothetical protein